MEPLELSQTVMDPYSARILLGTCDAAASALDLSRRFRIPIAACYRRIRQLERMGLVYCERALPSRNGKGLQLFRSRLKSVRVSLEDGRLKASIVIDDGPIPRASEQTLNLIEVARSG
ncbi:MAG TPA: helix-turn-helix domain-containing protein [Thermoplasmata archaeon]|nr:helix-turn-helix domain-containing protein [Thermoplasmata archaeon]